MANRPLGIYLLVGLTTLFGLAALASAGQFASAEPPMSAPDSVHLLFTLYPVFTALWGVLGLGTAILIWIRHRYGRTVGLLWAGIWILEELIMLVWTQTGPEIVTEAADGFGSNLFNMLIGSIIIYYLWRLDDSYWLN